MAAVSCSTSAAFHSMASQRQHDRDNLGWLDPHHKASAKHISTCRFMLDRWFGGLTMSGIDPAIFAGDMLLGMSLKKARIASSMPLVRKEPAICASDDDCLPCSALGLFLLRKLKMFRRRNRVLT
jgi:hypothetical protein